MRLHINLFAVIFLFGGLMFLNDLMKPNTETVITMNLMCLCIIIINLFEQLFEILTKKENK